MPRTDACAAKQSLALHVTKYYDRVRAQKKPPVPEVEKAVARTLLQYKPWTVYIRLSEEAWFEKEFSRALQDIDLNSTPGYCELARFGSDNRTALKVTVDPVTGRRIFDPERLEILKFLVEQRWEFGKADPLKVFIKQEPHKEAKLVEGRYRLISAVSLVDTMVDRILFGAMSRKALETVTKTPCFVGWSPISGGWRLMNSLFPEGTLSIDKSAWDWTVQSWLVAAWKRVLTELHPLCPDWWWERMQHRFNELFNKAVFKFSDGVEVEQGNPGIMKSGCYLTLLLNSLGQTILHHLVAQTMSSDVPTPLSFGDDIVMRPFDGMEEYLQKLGTYCLVKEPEVAPFVQFIGFIINKRGFVPQYWQKHIYRLMHLDMNVAKETLHSYQVLYAYDPVMLKFIRNFACTISPEYVVGDRELREIIDP